MVVCLGSGAGSAVSFAAVLSAGAGSGVGGGGMIGVVDCKKGRNEGTKEEWGDSVASDDDCDDSGQTKLFRLRLDNVWGLLLSSCFVSSTKKNDGSTFVVCCCASVEVVVDADAAAFLVRVAKRSASSVNVETTISFFFEGRPFLSWVSSSSVEAVVAAALRPFLPGGGGSTK